MTGKIDLKRDLWKHLSKSPFLMLGLTGSNEHSEPLTAQLDDEQVDRLWFFIGKDNRLGKGGSAMAQFASKGHDFFACLAGTAALDNNRAMVEKLWSKQAEAWFPNGKDDPNLALLRFDITSAELSETDLSLSGRLKLIFGGHLQVDEMGSHARVGMTAANH